MTRNNSLFFSLALALPMLFALSGCEGGDGASCQLDTDCSSGLMCCKGTSALADRGTCAASCGTIDAGPRDMNVPDMPPVDAPMSDLGDQDLGISEDLGVDDMSVSIDLGEDASSAPDLGVDAGLGLDAGSLDAGAIDAGDGG
jgi:hypothetical protein